MLEKGSLCTSHTQSLEDNRSARPPYQGSKQPANQLIVNSRNLSGFKIIIQFKERHDRFTPVPFKLLSEEN